jgi:hypothetical protein
LAGEVFRVDGVCERDPGHRVDLGSLQIAQRDSVKDNASVPKGCAVGSKRRTIKRAVPAK